MAQAAKVYLNIKKEQTKFQRKINRWCNEWLKVEKNHLCADS